MEIDDIRELVKLSPGQKKAWNRLAKAHKDFMRAGGKYYTVLGSIHGYNGEYIDYVEDDLTVSGYNSPLNVDNYYLPSISDEGLSSFADDTHVFVLKDI